MEFHQSHAYLNSGGLGRQKTRGVGTPPEFPRIFARKLGGLGTPRVSQDFRSSVEGVALQNLERARALRARARRRASRGGARAPRGRRRAPGSGSRFSRKRRTPLYEGTDGKITLAIFPTSMLNRLRDRSRDRLRDRSRGRLRDRLPRPAPRPVLRPVLRPAPRPARVRVRVSGSRASGLGVSGTRGLWGSGLADSGSPGLGISGSSSGHRQVTEWLCRTRKMEKME